MPLFGKNRAKQDKPERPKETLPESIAGIASVLVVGLFILTFVVQHFEIPSRSVEKTLLVGDHVFVDRLTTTGKSPMGWLFAYHEIRRGQTAVFMTPDPTEQGLYLVKRIVGVPGDHLRLHDGNVYLNDVRQNEPYVTVRNGIPDAYRDEFPSYSAEAIGQMAPGWYATLKENTRNDEVVIPPDHYFAMGDSRDNSKDSRYFGFVPKENIIGRPLFIFWSFDLPEESTEPKPFAERNASFLHTTVHFVSLTRWKRAFHLVH
ncbi:MAG TPA: signal peptidase I [Candidatus Sulfotelmatobacter sp.]|nr:signal peptidase I [Candidatus Sulfotelmatobacter sp.]